MKRVIPFLVIISLAACGDLINGLGGGVSGNVNGKSFVDAVAVADRNGDGSFVITISDTSEFACTASNGLPEAYLTIVVDDVREAPMEMNAPGAVFFNDFENGVADSESATSGSVTIDEIGTFTIDGSLDASSGTSSVSGTFSADICN